MTRCKENQWDSSQPSAGDSEAEPAQGLHLIGTYNQATAEGCAAVVVETRLVANERHVTYRTIS